MKTIIIFLSIILTSSFLYSQSTLVYDEGTVIDVGAGADVCADTITVNGTFSGNGTFCNSPLLVEIKDDLGTPKEYSLAQNHPNPFNPMTIIIYQLPVDGYVALNVYDVLGRNVAALVDEVEQAGGKSVQFDGIGLPSGIYFYKLTAGSFTQIKKMVMMK